MVNPMVTLVADGGDITIGRRVSSFIYGVMNVTAAEGVATPEDDTGLEFGYICRADGDVPRGRFDFNFTRHDAQMRMADKGGDGSSDMEQGIVAASRRSSGDVFFERDIEPGGFGRWVPGRDFKVGDVVGVRLWGRIIPLPVTSLSLKNGRWVAHVGGQMIHDAEKLKSQNQSIEKTIADERRRQAKETKAIASTANSAKREASQATVVAQEAKSAVVDATGTIQKSLADARSAASSASDSLSLSRQETSKAGEYSHQAFLHLQDAQAAQADVSAKHQVVLEKHTEAIVAAQSAIDANTKADAARDNAIEANRKAGLALADAQQVAQAQTDQLRKVQNTMQVTRTIAVMGDVMEMIRNGGGRMDVPGYGYLETNTGAFEATQLYFRKRGDWSGTVHFIIKFKGVATNDNVEIAGGRIEKWHPEDHGIGGKVGGVGYYTGFLMQIYPDPPENII